MIRSIYFSFMFCFLRFAVSVHCVHSIDILNILTPLHQNFFIWHFLINNIANTALVTNISCSLTYLMQMPGEILKKCKTRKWQVDIVTLIFRGPFLNTTRTGIKWRQPVAITCCQLVETTYFYVTVIKLENSFSLSRILS